MQNVIKSMAVIGLLITSMMAYSSSGKIKEIQVIEFTANQIPGLAPDELFPIVVIRLKETDTQTHTECPTAEFYIRDNKSIGGKSIYASALTAQINDLNVRLDYSYTTVYWGAMELQQCVITGLAIETH